MFLVLKVSPIQQSQSSSSVLPPFTQYQYPTRENSSSFPRVCPEDLTSHIRSSYKLDPNNWYSICFQDQVLNLACALIPALAENVQCDRKLYAVLKVTL